MDGLAGIPILVVLIQVAAGYVGYQDNQICISRDIQIGDVIALRGTLLPGAQRWSCSLESATPNGAVFILADHLIYKNETTYSSKYAGDAWPIALNYGPVPYTPPATFIIVFTISGLNQVIINYQNSPLVDDGGNQFDQQMAWTGFENIRKIRCDGDISGVAWNRAIPQVSCPTSQSITRPVADMPILTTTAHPATTTFYPLCP
ncbi:unnamed protein product, partial [Mesorhabditis spiculigera]